MSQTSSTTGPTTTSTATTSPTTTSTATIEDAVATARPDSVASDDGTVSLPVHVAGGHGEGTTPEDLMAAALASCLQQAVGIAASQHGVDASQTSVRAVVHLLEATGTNASDTTAGEASDGRDTADPQRSYRATFDLSVAGLPDGKADDVLTTARQICPFTNALAAADLDVHLAA